MVVLADTGVLFGGADRDDPRHSDCVEVLDAHGGDLAVVVLVIVEVCWLIETRLGAAAEAVRMKDRRRPVESVVYSRPMVALSAPP